MKHPTSEEIWGPGDWWQRRINKQKINKHLGRYGHYLPGNKQSKHDENIEKIFGVKDSSSFYRLWRFILNPIVVYTLGIFLVRIIWGSWFFGIAWPMIAPFWILTKFI